MRWSLNSSPSRTIVCPALLPPWKRATTSAFSASRSVILPLPSSPHWAPTTTVPGTLPSVQDASRGDDAGRRGLYQASRDAGAIAYGVQVLDRRLQASVQLGPGRIELDLDAVEQRVAPVHAGRQPVHDLEHVEDVAQVTVGQHEAEVARRGALERGLHGTAADALRGAAVSLLQVAEALHDDVLAEQVRQSRDALAISDGVVERLGEVGAHKQGEVGAVGLRGGVAVAVHGDHVAVVLQRDLAVRVHAEGAHRVVEARRVVDQLALVKRGGERLHDRRRRLDPHADVHRVGAQLDAQAFALVHQPAGALAPGGDDDGVGGELAAAVEDDAGSAQVAFAGSLLGEDALDPDAGAHGDALLKLLTHARENVVGALRAHVAHRRGHERHAVQQRLTADLVRLRAAAVDLIGGAVFQPDAVHVLDELAQALLGHELVEPAADLGGERELAVAEGAGAAPAAGDVARLAAVADAGRAGRAGAAADVGAAFHQSYAETVVAHQLERGEDARRACADDDHIEMSTRSIHRRNGGRSGKGQKEGPFEK